MTSTTGLRETLEPCPFCGATPHRGITKQIIGQDGEPFQRYRVWCPRGHAQIEEVNEQLAAEAWNRRPFPQVSEAMVDAAAEVLKAWNMPSGWQTAARLTLNSTLSASMAGPVPEGWRNKDDVPDTPRGSERYFIIAVKRARTGKTYSFPAKYLNAYPLIYNDGCGGDHNKSCPEDGSHEEGCPTTGWYYESSDGEFDSNYSRIHLDPGDEFVAWREIDRYPDAGAPAPALPEAKPVASPAEGEAVLPCDVKLPPATTITKGCNLSTLLLALQVRGMVMPEPDKEAATREAVIEECAKVAETYGTGNYAIAEAIRALAQQAKPQQGKI